MYLIFGSRNKAKDYYFGQEWVKMQENYENFKIFTAFSRDQDDKCYVQHVIRVRNKSIFLCRGPSIHYVSMLLAFFGPTHLRQHKYTENCRFSDRTNLHTFADVIYMDGPKVIIIKFHLHC